MIIFLIILAVLELAIIAVLALWGTYLWKKIVAYRNDEYDNIPLDPINLDYYPESVFDGGSKNE